MGSGVAFEYEGIVTVEGGKFYHVIPYYEFENCSSIINGICMRNDAYSPRKKIELQ